MFTLGLLFYFLEFSDINEREWMSSARGRGSPEANFLSMRHRSMTGSRRGGVLKRFSPAMMNSLKNAAAQRKRISSRVQFIIATLNTFSPKNCVSKTKNRLP